MGKRLRITQAGLEAEKLGEAASELLEVGFPLRLARAGAASVRKEAAGPCRCGHFPQIVSFPDPL